MLLPAWLQYEFVDLTECVVGAQDFLKLVASLPVYRYDSMLQRIRITVRLFLLYDQGSAQTILSRPLHNLVDYQKPAHISLDQYEASTLHAPEQCCTSGYRCQLFVDMQKYGLEPRQ